MQGNEMEPGATIPQKYKYMMMTCVITLILHIYVYDIYHALQNPLTFMGIAWFIIKFHMLMRLLVWLFLKINDSVFGTHYSSQTQGWSVSMLHLETPMFMFTVVPLTLKIH